MSEIAKNINKLMILEGINASDLSRKTGVDRSVLHKILSGATKNPSIDSIKSIIQHYGFEEVVFGGASPQKPIQNEVPILSWSEIADFKSNMMLKSQHKMASIGITVPNTSFALIIQHQFDNRFRIGTLIIVDIEKKPKNLSYIIITEIETKFSTLKRYISDGSLIYLKSIESSIPSIQYEPEKHLIVGVVIQSIFNYE